MKTLGTRVELGPKLYFSMLTADNKSIFSLICCNWALIVVSVSPQRCERLRKSFSFKYLKAHPWHNASLTLCDEDHKAEQNKQNSFFRRHFQLTRAEKIVFDDNVANNQEHSLAIHSPFFIFVYCVIFRDFLH